MRGNEKRPWRMERFRIETTIHYRMAGESDWHSGTTEDISGSGALVRAEPIARARTAIEMIFVVPVEMVSHAGGVVVCTGQVVRTVPAATANGLPGFAASITKYHLLRQPTVAGA